MVLRKAGWFLFVFFSLGVGVYPALYFYYNNDKFD